MSFFKNIEKGLYEAIDISKNLKKENMIYCFKKDCYRDCKRNLKNNCQKIVTISDFNNEIKDINNCKYYIKK